MAQGSELGLQWGVEKSSEGGGFGWRFESDGPCSLGEEMVHSKAGRSQSALFD